MQWELDLHGLHVSEAVQALAARLDLLQDVVHDLKQQAAAGPFDAAAAMSALAVTNESGGMDGARGSSRKQAVLSSLLLAADGHEHVPWEQQCVVLRQELRVIVGKGHHSTNYEPSLPGAVEQYLQEHKYRYIHRGGCLGVLLKLF